MVSRQLVYRPLVHNNSPTDFLSTGNRSTTIPGLKLGLGYRIKPIVGRPEVCRRVVADEKSVDKLLWNPNKLMIFTLTVAYDNNILTKRVAPEIQFGGRHFTLHSLVCLAMPPSIWFDALINY